MKTLNGIVTSLAREKTATVEVTRRWKHPLYKKYVKRSKKYAAHVEGLNLEIGDKVIIQECRPISKTKFFKVVEKIDDKA
jgi:small subunit ribosomal protein S17